MAGTRRRTMQRSKTPPHSLTVNFRPSLSLPDIAKIVRRTRDKIKATPVLMRNSVNQKRKMKFVNRFLTFLPVHELWKKYIQNLLQLREKLPDDLSYIYQKLLRADYHGCLLVVASSTCSSYVGLRGIVVQETRNVFKLITEENKIKIVPKKGNVFCFELCDHVIKIYGDNFKYVPYERTRVKYKIKSVVDP